MTQLRKPAIERRVVNVFQSSRAEKYTDIDQGTVAQGRAE